MVGFAKDGRARKVIGIDASFTPAQTKAQVLSIAQNTARLIDLGHEIVEDDVVLIEDYAHPAYGIPSEDTKEAIRLCARLEGMAIPVTGGCLFRLANHRLITMAAAKASECLGLADDRSVNRLRYRSLSNPSQSWQARSRTAE